jgi:hypothetical protein
VDSLDLKTGFVSWIPQFLHTGIAIQPHYLQASNPVFDSKIATIISPLDL